MAEPHKEPEHHKGKAENEQHDAKRILAHIHDLKALVANLCERPKADTTQEQLEHERNRRPLWGAFGATCLYCIAAFFQWNSMRDSAITTKIAMRAEQRAWVYGSSPDFKDIPIVEGQELSAKVSFVNTGKTPARNIFCASILRVVPNDGRPLFLDSEAANLWTMGAMFPNERRLCT